MVFGDKAYRAIDRELQRRERAVEGSPEERRRLVAARFQFLQLLLSEPLPGRCKKRLMVAYWPAAALEIRVYAPSRSGPKLRCIDVLRVPKERRRFDGLTVNWADPEKTNQAIMAMLRKHFPLVWLMGRRPGQRWRTRRSPEGWPLITQYVVPGLYDYLRPYYATRAYRKRARPTGDYPADLLREIVEILGFELPHLAKDLTVPRVKAAIQRYLKAAPSDRPMGVAIVFA